MVRAPCSSHNQFLIPTNSINLLSKSWHCYDKTDPLTSKIELIELGQLGQGSPEKSETLGTPLWWHNFFYESKYNNLIWGFIGLQGRRNRLNSFRTIGWYLNWPLVVLQHFFFFLTRRCVNIYRKLSVLPTNLRLSVRKWYMGVSSLLCLLMISLTEQATSLHYLWIWHSRWFS